MRPTKIRLAIASGLIVLGLIAAPTTLAQVTPASDELQHAQAETGTLTLVKECVVSSSFFDEPWDIDVLDAAGEESVIDAPVALGCGDESAPIPLPAGSYVVRETEMPEAADDVRYRGDCDGGGELTVTAGAARTCVVTNVDLVYLVLTKVCVPSGQPGGPYVIDVYRGHPEDVSLETLEETVTLSCGQDNSDDPVELDRGEPYLIQQRDGASFSGDCLQDGFFARPIQQDSSGEDLQVINCNVITFLPEPETLTVIKQCLGSFESGPWDIDVLDSSGEDTAIGGPIALECGASQSFVLLEGDYIVRETEPPAEADEVRYFGDCAEDGSITLTENVNRACVVINVIEQPLVITKECEGGVEGPFTIELYRESVFPVNLVATLELECGQSSPEIAVDDGITYIVRETDAGGAEVTFSDDCVPADPAFGVIGVISVEGEGVNCTVTNSGSEPQPVFRKYTDTDDEVLEPGEEFIWYIDVPANPGHWRLTDKLPQGFVIVGKVEPDASCKEWSNRGRGTAIACSGGRNEAMTITVRVRAPGTCGEFTNTATLKRRNAVETASDTVRVEGC